MTELNHQLWLASIIGKDLLEGEARELFMISRREHYKKGEALFEEGSDAVALYLIAEGNVDIIKKAQKGTMLLAQLNPGSIAGEMSLLTKERRSASAIVSSETATMFKIAWRDFEDLLGQNPAVAYKLMYALARVLAQRLRNINARIVDMSERSPHHTPHEQIEEFAAFKNKLFADWSF